MAYSESGRQVEKLRKDIEGLNGERQKLGQLMSGMETDLVRRGTFAQENMIV